VAAKPSSIVEGGVTWRRRMSHIQPVDPAAAQGDGVGLTPPSASSDVAFTASVKAVQERRGSRQAYRQIAEKGGWCTTVTPELAAFLAERNSMYLATANAGGQPYIQHRGGPKGFLRVLDEKTLAFVDYAGNRQYISTGNLAENDQAFLFLTDYAHRRRVKIWGRAKVVENNPELMALLMPSGYRARGEQVILFAIEAWDVNCPQHIPQLIDAAEVAVAFEKLQTQIAELEGEIAQLRGRLADVTNGREGGVK
jgi:hypothetical protein